MRKRKSPLSIFRDVIGVLIIVCALFLLLEGGIRLYDYLNRKNAPLAPAPVKTMFYDKYGVGFHEPNQDFIDTAKFPLRYHVKINRFGFRGGDFTKVKRVGVTRIMLLGDSFIYGMGLNEEDTLSSRMGGRLDRLYGKGKYQVINAGYMGSYLKMETTLYNNYAKIFRPNILILGFFINDIIDPLYYNIFEESVPEPLSGKSLMGRSAGNELSWLRDFRFYNLILKKKADWLFNHKYKHLSHCKNHLSSCDIEKLAKGASPEIDELVKNYENNLLIFRNQLKHDDVELLFIIFPNRIEEKDIKRPIQRELYDFAASNGIAAIDLREAWSKHNPDIRAFFLERDKHPSPDGIKAIAPVIIQTLQDQKMIGSKDAGAL